MHENCDVLVLGTRYYWVRVRGGGTVGLSLSEADRRKSQRLRLQVPMFIRGTDLSGEEFLDLTKTLDISATGAYLASPRALRKDELISLTIPAPSPSTTGLLPAGNSPIQARVRRLGTAGDVHLVGVEFLRSVG